MGQDIEVIRDKNSMRNWSRAKRAQGEKIGLVPTMGYLHRGHLALVEEAKTRATRVVVSIYINPAQFAVGEDFSTYPSNFEGDLAKLKEMGVDTVFFPSDLYVREDNAGAGKGQDNNAGGCISCLEVKSGNGHETWIRVEKMEKPLCGKSRPIFFKGVATVVAKLFNIVEPDFAFFGKKDYQQWRVICRMALSICRSLNQVKDAVCNGQISTEVLRDSVLEAVHNAGGKVDYVEIVDRETLQHVDRIDFSVVLCVAAWFGGVRLIDNIELQPPNY